jgi:hypothetical protein
MQTMALQGVHAQHGICSYVNRPAMEILKILALESDTSHASEGFQGSSACRGTTSTTGRALIIVDLWR